MSLFSMTLTSDNIGGAVQQIHPLVYLGLLLLLSYLGGEVATYCRVPRVTGYLVIGMLLSPSALGIFHERLIKEELSPITDIALSVIAFSIGGSLELATLRRLGKHIMWITLTQGVGAFLVATAVLALFFPIVFGEGYASPSFWSVYAPVAVVIGAICAATAPAAILAIVHEYRAKGPFTTILLGVVALDDALTIVLYAFALTVAGTLINHEPFAWQNLLVTPSLLLLVSLAIGGGVGVGFRSLMPFVPRREALLGLIMRLIFLASGLAMTLEASPLLANMMFGFVVANFVGQHKDLFAIVEGLEEAIFGMFFALAGAHFDLQVLESAGWLALLISLGRFSGKMLGSHLGARLSHAPNSVKKYLGLALLPTAGVTVGLVFDSMDVLGHTRLADVILNGVLGSVILNELVTPFLVRFTLFRAGEAVRGYPVKG